MANRSRILAAVGLALGLLIVSPVTSWARRRKPPPEYAVVAGTVFQQSGFTLPGAQVTVTPVPEKGASGGHLRKQKTYSDRMGEFAVRVPAGAMRYTVSVKAKGWQPAEKTVQVQWSERTNIVFRLKPVPGKKKSQ